MSAEWSPTGRSPKGWRDWLLVVGAAAWHVLSLAWLRGPRWANEGEAALELARLVREHEGLDWAWWSSHIDQQKRVEFRAASATWYQATVQAMWDDRPGGAIRVFVSIDDGGRSAFRPMTTSLLIERRDAAA